MYSFQSSLNRDNIILRRTSTLLMMLLSCVPFIVPILSIITCVAPIGSVRILAIETVAGKSHWNFLSSILRVLSENGHDVTAFTPFPDGDAANYTEVDISHVLPRVAELTASFLFENFCKSTAMIPLIMNITRYNCQLIHDDSRMKNILYGNDNRSDYDIVFGEVSASECLSYVAAILKLPLIYAIPSPMITHIEYDLFGHVPNPATVPNLVSDYAALKTFFQRLENSVFMAYYMLSGRYVEWTMRRNDPQPFDSVDPVKPSLVFTNAHYITEPARPLPPNLVQIGGIHLKPPKGLPKDILEFIEASPNGVIYFTFGSVVKMSTLPGHMLKAFKEALAQVPQRVLWKYEGEMENVPKNVMIKKWFPQRDILLHPKVKLFISHGGISGIYETVDAGVPVLGFPLFYDQHRNIANLVDAEMAISMELSSVSKDTLLNSILELVNNEKYLKNAKITSERFKDRPMSPEKSIVYWTEYVHRHKGAPHLKSHALTLTWYQYYLLDVITAILICIFITLSAIYFVIQIIFKYVLLYLQNVKSKSE